MRQPAHSSAMPSLRDLGPAPLALPGPAAHRPPPPSYPDVVPGRSRRAGALSMGLAWRGIRRHWALGFVGWAAGTAGLVTWADRAIRPSYEAATLIKVERGPRVISDDFAALKQTQALRVAGPVVVAEALRDRPDLAGLPTVAAGPEPEAAVVAAIHAEVVAGTDLIRAAMTSPSEDEPARVVDAVVAAFLRDANQGDEESARKGRRLRDARGARRREVADRRDEIVVLAARLGAIDTVRARERDAVALDQYKTLSSQRLQADLDLLASQVRLDQVRDRPAVVVAPSETDPGKVDPAVVTAFYADLEVVAIRSRVDAARDELAQSDRVAKASGEAPRAAARKAIDDGQKQIDALWARKKPALVQALRPAVPPPDVEAHHLHDRVAGLKATTAQLDERLARLADQTRAAGADELTLEFKRQDLGRSEAVLDALTKDVERHEIDAEGASARFRQEYPARVVRVSDRNRKVAAIASAPIAMFLGVVGLLVLAELGSGRVVGPDDLPTTLRPRVLGVLPVLPRADPRDPRHRHDFERFVQGLDHLRVVLCDRRDHPSRRCLLITSASGGEGKTTLAAQLAERCVSAGLTTLLIDADFRNPSLSRMFDHAGSRGLADVLRGEATAEEAIAVIGDAGGVHFLPAGTDRADPARLLHGDALGRLLARARESFAMVLVDSPPVLPVPDALTIGRWVDAAVLSVRSDSSRFPLVEQADSRLASMGIPVLGAVVCGVRDHGKAYGYPARGESVVTTLDG